MHVNWQPLISVSESLFLLMEMWPFCEIRICMDKTCEGVFLIKESDFSSRGLLKAQEMALRLETHATF